MTLKQKLYSVSLFLHSFLFIVAWSFQQELGLLLIGVEVMLFFSLLCFLWLIKKGLQPLEYIETFSSLLKEQEFTNRFSRLNEKDLDKLIEQFNSMLERLHQERLAAGEQRGLLQKLLQESPVGVLVLDFDNRISDINPAAEKLLSIHKNEFIKYPILKSKDQRLMPLINQAADSHKMVTTENGKRLKIGHYKMRDRGFARSFYMLYELTGEINASQKSAYEKLIRLMSHEVNNTIAATNSLLESCLIYKKQLPQESKENYQQALNIAIQRSSSLNHFMQAYANVVKLPKPIFSTFDLARLLNNLSILFHSECQQNSIQLSLNKKQNVMVKADAHLIEQAIVNIIKNAIEAIIDGRNFSDKKQGLIDITIVSENKHHILRIKDNGCGIKEEVKQQLFSPFFTTKDTGQGIGLMLIQEILNQHQLEYQLSNNEKIGACFSIKFPFV